MSWFDDEFSDHPQTPADIIRDAYRKFLGRDPSYQEINSQTGNGSFGLNDPRLQMSVNNIAQSPEAVQYGLAHPQGTGGGGSNSGGGDGLSFDDLMGKLRQA